MRATHFPPAWNRSSTTIIISCLEEVVVYRIPDTQDAPAAREKEEKKEKKEKKTFEEKEEKWERGTKEKDEGKET